ncbi:TolC family protein [Chitinophaga oryzae]|uniref:TolC family protein n=1 Tax=Chitinophaga oryzae TaxID=2725414 RepID=A0AAE6ZDJ7_9BACT|nr:TolC family protein [Chitinophaga oryzae]QJB30966.1 TolC family protein [Chitinophaga oryzae]
MRYRLLVFLLLIALQKSGAQSAPVLQPDSMLSRIAHSHLLLQANTLRAQAYRLSAGAALAWAPPVVGAGTFMIPWSARYVYNDVALGSRIVQVEQEIPHPGRLRARYRYLAFQTDMVQTAQTILLHRLHFTARQQYIHRVMALQKAAVLQRQEQVLSFLHQVALVRLPYRQAQVADVSMAAARLTEVRTRIRLEEALAAGSKARLCSLLSLPEDFTTDSLYAPVFTPGHTDTVSLARTNQEVYQLEEAIRWQYLNRKALRQEQKPDFKAGFYQFFPLSPLVPNSFNIMAGIRIPLAPWAAGYHRRKARAIQADIAALTEQRTNLLQQTQARLAALERDIRDLQQRVYGMSEKIIPLLQQALEADMARYRENRLDLATVLRSLEAVTIMELQLREYRQQLYEMIAVYDWQLYR